MSERLYNIQRWRHKPSEGTTGTTMTSFILFVLILLNTGLSHSKSYISYNRNPTPNPEPEPRFKNYPEPEPETQYRNYPEPEPRNYPEPESEPRTTYHSYTSHTKLRTSTSTSVNPQYCNCSTFVDSYGNGDCNGKAGDQPWCYVSAAQVLSDHVC